MFKKILESEKDLIQKKIGEKKIVKEFFFIKKNSVNFFLTKFFFYHKLLVKKKLPPKFWSYKLGVKKEFGRKISLQTNFLSTKILEQKIFEGQKIFGVKTNFWDQKVFSGKKIW